MKFKHFLIRNICFSAIIVWFVNCPVLAQDNKVALSVAALSLPDGSDGKLHWNSGKELVTQPLQLSSRYFSDPLEAKSRILRFYAEPIIDVTKIELLPKPLLSIKIPSDTRNAFLVIFGTTNSENRQIWRGLTIKGEDWDAGTLRVVNLAKDPVGMKYPGKLIKLQPGKHVEFKAKDWTDPFPMKIFQLKPEQKLVFSSKWRVTAGRREICFLSKAKRSVSLRSLLVLNKRKE